MTIYYIFNSYLAEGLGGLGHVWEVAEHMHKYGHKVVIFAPRAGPYRRQTPVRIVYVPTIDLPFLRSVLFNFFSFFYILSYSFKQPPDIFYFRESVLLITPVIISTILRTPLITEVNGDSIDVLNTEGFHPLLISFLQYIQRITLHHSATIVCVTEGLKSILLNRYLLSPENIHVIPNGTNIDLFRPLDQHGCQQDLHLDSAKSYVGFIGTFLPHQGLDTLINAAPHIITRVPNVTFLLIGDGPIRSRLEHLIREKDLSPYFLLTGSVGPDKLVLYINAMDVCVAPFTRMRNEHIGLSPLKLYDYLACAKPIIASNIKGVGDLISQNNVGIQVPPDDPHSLANAICTLLTNHTLRVIYSRNGRTLVKENYNWALTAQKILSICSSTTTKRDPRTAKGSY